MDMSPEELQAWCDAQPEYAAFKAEGEQMRRSTAKEMGISYEELMQTLEKGL